MRNESSAAISIRSAVSPSTRAISLFSKPAPSPQLFHCMRVLPLPPQPRVLRNAPGVAYSHSGVLAFDVAGRDMLLIGIANLGFLAATGAYCGAVSFLAVGIVAVNLHQHGVVDVFAESVRYRCGRESTIWEKRRASTF